MRFFLFPSGEDSDPHVGAQATDGGNYLDLTAHCAAITPNFGGSMRKFLGILHNEDSKWDGLREHIKAGLGDASLFTGDASAVRFLAPIHDPEKIICVGMNYLDHCTEQGLPAPETPVLFNKFPSAIRGDGDDVWKLRETAKLDWEVEMVIVVGKDARRVRKEDAFDHVAGYTVAHDVSARDLQLEQNGGQWLLGKAFDHACPIGPVIADKGSVPDPHSLRLRCLVNGEVVQDSSTEQMIHKVDDIIAYTSQYMTLRAGDLILTGTPPGVGCFLKPPRFLSVGDVVQVEVESIGSISNPIVEDGSVAASSSSASASSSSSAAAAE